MLNKYKQVLLFLLLFGLVSQPVVADETFFSASCNSPFPETMAHLHELIHKQGYTISHVQSVDKGLKARGYETGFYRVVFFGKKEHIQLIRTQYPALIPYIPLSITIFEDGERTGISAIDPMALYKLYKSEKIKSLTESWSKDIASVFAAYKNCSI